MNKHTRHWLSPQILVIAVLCMTASFGVGIKTTGEVQTVDHTAAEETQVITGDMDENGKTDMNDVIVMLEIVRGYQIATPSQLRAELTGDGQISIDDALQLLRDLQHKTL